MKRDNLVRFLESKATKIESAETTNSIYFTINGILIRYSDHFSTIKYKDFTICIVKSDDEYITFISDAACCLKKPKIFKKLKDVKSFINTSLFIYDCYKSATTTNAINSLKAKIASLENKDFENKANENKSVVVKKKPKKNTNYNSFQLNRTDRISCKDEDKDNYITELSTLSTYFNDSFTKNQKKYIVDYASTNKWNMKDILGLITKAEDTHYHNWTNAKLQQFTYNYSHNVA